MGKHSKKEKPKTEKKVSPKWGKHRLIEWPKDDPDAEEPKK